MKWARRFIYGVVAIFTLEAIWLFAANRYLQSQHFRDLLQEGSYRITYDAAFTSMPGHLHVTGFTLQDKELLIEAPDLRLDFSILGLIGRKLIFWSARSQGGIVRYVPQTTASAKAEPAATAAPASAPSASPAAPTEKSAWSVHFKKLQFKNLTSLTIDAYTARGSIDCEASLHVEADNQVSLADGRVRVRETNLLWQDKSAARLQNLLGHFQVDPIGAQDNVLRKLTLDVSGAAVMEQTEGLQKLLLDASWLRLHGLHLNTTGRVVIKQGVLAPKTRVEVKTQNLALDLWKETFTGDGSFTLIVDKDLNLDVAIPNFQVQDTITGSGLTMHMESEDRDLLSDKRPWQAAFRLQSAHVKNLSGFNHFLPKGLGFQFKGGEADLFVNLDSRTTSGNLISLNSRNAAVQYGKQEFFGRLDHDLRIGAIDFARESFNIPAGDISMQVKTGGADSKEPDWKGQLHLSNARVVMRTPARFEGDVALKAQDLRPLLWAYDPKHKLPDWARKLFQQQSLGAHFHIKADEDSYVLDPFKAETSDLKLEAWLQGNGQKKRGKLFVRYGSLSAGVGVNDEQFHVQLLSSREWFQDRG